MKQPIAPYKNEAVATSKILTDENEKFSTPIQNAMDRRILCVIEISYLGETQNHLTGKEGEKDVAMERAWCGEDSVFVTFSAQSGNICR